MEAEQKTTFRRAINTLKARIEKIEERMKETQKIIDEPEMMCDYEFAINDMGNYELEIMELQNAIQTLLSLSEVAPKEEKEEDLLAKGTYCVYAGNEPCTFKNMCVHCATPLLESNKL